MIVSKSTLEIQTLLACTYDNCPWLKCLLTWSHRYTFNDAAGYGIQEMIENRIVDLNKSKNIKDKWIIVVCLEHLILEADVQGWQSM